MPRPTVTRLVFWPVERAKPAGTGILMLSAEQVPGTDLAKVPRSALWRAASEVMGEARVKGSSSIRVLRPNMVVRI